MGMENRWRSFQGAKLSAAGQAVELRVEDAGAVERMTGRSRPGVERAERWGLAGARHCRTSQTPSR